jgi:hypothetical protein
MGRHEGAGRIARLRRVFAMSQELGGGSNIFLQQGVSLGGTVDATVNRARVSLRRKLLRCEQRCEQQYPGRKARLAAIAT